MKTVFITGISRGLGLKLTEHYLHKGYRVIGVSRTLSNELKLLKNELQDTLKWRKFYLVDLPDLEFRVE